MISDLDSLESSHPRSSEPSAPSSLHRRVMDFITHEPARVTTDTQGRIVAINPAFSELCGYSFSEVKGKKPGSFLQGPETNHAAVQVIRDAVRLRQAATTTLTNYHKNGSTYRVRIEVSPVFDPQGVLCGFRAKETKLS